jgi:hypothetical protein
MVIGTITEISGLPGPVARVGSQQWPPGLGALAGLEELA